ncbi:hypothetical protein [Nitrosopumilus sp. S6]
MSYADELDKDRSYASQCFTRVRWYCPVCVVQKKIKKHCKIHKSPASWWWHIKHDHGSFVNRKFSFDDLRIVSNHMTKALEWGIISESGIDEFFDEPTPTSSSLIYRGRPARNDVQRKLVKIGSKFKEQSQSYPYFSLNQIHLTISLTIGPIDSRTLDSYADCVIRYSSEDAENNAFDVTDFCSRLGV